MEGKTRPDTTVEMGVPTLRLEAFIATPDRSLAQIAKLIYVLS
jgi:hypothetical protein